ncbi:MAG TPA: S41 family peptidase [Dehalococcoidia bacterium]|nr:S41 family peptidase [Dehalococcoidia bacterium]
MLNAARWTVYSLLGVALLALAFTVGYVVGGGDEGSPSAPPSSATEDGEIDFRALNEILAILRRDYIDPDLIDPETMYQGAINGLLESVKDTGTFYVDPRTYRTTVGPEGTFDGIGATVAEQNGEIVIVAPIEGTPAERAGLQRGDVILEVDGESTKGWTVEEAVLRIRGQRGTVVTLKIRHPDGSEEVVSIERAEIKVQSVSTIPPGGELKNAAGQTVTDIGYIQIREFNRPTEGEVERAIQELRDAGARGIILDLRNNPGGLLETTVNIADMFLDSGAILYEEHKDGTEQVYQAREGGPATDLPVVILINQFSASGSEVLAAALRDNGRATIVGEKSFGKGTVNVPRELSDGGALFVTIARWLTPKRVQIDGVGITPDVQVTPSDEDIDLRRDAQLLRAIDLLEGMVRAGVASPAR